MFKIYDGRESFYQWDLNRKLIIVDASITEVHFCNRTDDCSLVVEVVDGLANVPNILLQDNWRIKVYAYDGEATLHSATFEVIARTKPADYVYTETEVINWEAIEKKIEDATSPEAIKEAIGGDVLTADNFVEFYAGETYKNEELYNANTLNEVFIHFGERVENLEKKTETINNCSNALKGEAKGSGIVTLDGISPIPVNIECDLSLKNLLNPVNVIPGLLTNADGSVSTGSNYGTVFRTVYIELPPGTYTISFGVAVNIVRQVLDGAFTTVGVNNKTSYTFTTTGGAVGYSFRDYTSSAVEWDDTTTIQIERGSSATEYAPYVEAGEQTIRVTHKNIFDGNLIDSTNAPTIYKRIEMYLPVGKYVFTTSKDIYLQAKSINMTYTRVGNNTYYLTVTESGNSFLQFRDNTSSATEWDYTTKLQLEVGTVATEYEEYYGKDYIVQVPGTLTITPDNDVMNIINTNPGVVINAKYNRDINKAFAILEQAIISLGGNI